MILHYMTSFLSICTRHEAFGFFDCFALAATLLCLVRSILWKKMIFFHEIFQAGACPKLKISSIHEFFSIQMYKTDIVRCLQLFSLSATPYSFARYIILEKDDIS